MNAQRDREVVRRGLRAGLVTWAAVGGTLVGATILAGGGGATGLLAVVTGMAAGALVTSSWLLLSGILDLLADHRLGPRRLAWTAGAVVLTILSPLLVLGAASA